MISRNLLGGERQRRTLECQSSEPQGAPDTWKNLYLRREQYAKTQGVSLIVVQSQSSKDPIQKLHDSLATSVTVPGHTFQVKR